MQKENEKFVDLFKWGLMPPWKKPLVDMLKHSKRTLNATSEDVRTTASYRSAIKNQRCVIPVNSFFEYKWMFDENSKVIDKLPYLIHPVKQPYFNLAGIYSYYKDEENDNWYKSFSIITEPANTFMADIHNSAKRMPLMLDSSLVNDWINPDSPVKLIDDIMQYACDDSSLSSYRVNRNLKKMPNTEDVLLAVSEQPEVPSDGNLFTL